MNRYQKIAWFNLIVMIGTIIITAIAVTIEFGLRGYSTIGLYFVGLLAFLRFSPFIFKKPHGKDTVVCDERDSFIIKRALSIAYTFFWIVFFVSSFTVYIFTGMGPKSTVPAITLPLMAIGGGLFMKMVCSIAILVQYGKGGSCNE